MKLKLFSLGLFSIAALSPIATPKAEAACVLTDIGVQVAIHSKNSTATQTNNVNQQASNDCFGNTATNTGVQVYTGSGSVQQTRNSNQVVVGGNNPTGINIAPVKIPVEVKVDVPAYP